MTHGDTCKIKVVIPAPGEHDGALITDSAGASIPCRSLRIAVNADTMTPVLHLEVINFEAQVIGQFVCEEVGRKPLFRPEDMP